jgi:hypothetical protein
MVPPLAELRVFPLHGMGPGHVGDCPHRWAANRSQAGSSPESWIELSFSLPFLVRGVTGDLRSTSI